MDTDIKNLFQRAGSQLSGYKEINRLQENEQAKQRWPLLRDIRIEQIPDQLDAGEEKTESSHLFDRLEVVADRSREPEDTVTGVLQGKHGANQDDIQQLRPFVPGKSADAYTVPAGSSPVERIAETVAVKVAELKPFESDPAGAKEEVSHLLSAVLGKEDEPSAAEEETENDAADKSRPVAELFRRLAGEPQMQNVPSPSFFRKMFGS